MRTVRPLFVSVLFACSLASAAASATDPLDVRVDETDRCHTSTHEDSARPRVVVEHGTLEIHVPDRTRSCHAHFVATARYLDEAYPPRRVPRVILLEISEREAPPPSRCICRSHLRIRIEHLLPGRVHLQAPVIGLVTDVTVS